MLITTPYVRFEMVTSSQEFNFNSSGNQSFADISLFKKSDNDFFNFITLELNKTVLNSEIDAVDDISEINHIAFVSNKLSDANCQFSDVAVYAVKIDGSANFYQLNLEFGSNNMSNDIKNYPKKIRVEYLSDQPENNREITIDNIQEQSIAVNLRGDSVTQVKIYFLESYQPFRFAYLQEIIFGVIYEWDQKNIIDLVVTEEIPYACNTLPVGKAALTLYLDGDEFSLISDNSARSYITEDHKFLIKEYIDDDETDDNISTINFGKYYIDNIKNEADHKVTFYLSTALSKLDKYQFMDSKMYNLGSDDNAFNILKNILNTAQLSDDDFEIDEDLKNELLIGYIPVMTCREALQRVLLASNALVYDSRYEKIIITKRDDSVNQSIVSSRIFEPVTIEQDDSNTKIEYEWPFYFAPNFEQTVASLEITESSQRAIMFQKPVVADSIRVNNGAEITKKNTLYAEINFPNAGDYEVKAIVYEETRFKEETATIKNINLKKFNMYDIKLFNYSIDNILQDLSNFNSEKITYKIDYLCTGQQVGLYTNFELAKPVDFLTSDGKIFKTADGKIFRVQRASNLITGWLGYQTIDLAHGMVAKAEIVLRK